jgi:urease subunit beta
MIPGEYLLAEGSIKANTNRNKVSITVTNTGDRPVQIGSHFHFFEVNRQLSFDRVAAYGMRLNIPSGTAVRFEPGEEKLVTLVNLGGNMIAYGFNGLINGSTTSVDLKEKALEKLDELEFKNLAP